MSMSSANEAVKAGAAEAGAMIASTVKATDISVTEIGQLSDGIDRLYDGSLDVILIRDALPRGPIESASEWLDQGRRDASWSRPNAVSKTDDIQLLGTPATPTWSTPQGPSREAYLATTDWYQANPVFEESFNPTRAITDLLQRLAGGRPVEILRFPDGRSFTPFTLRRLAAGQGISLHHDYHYPLALFSEIEGTLDKRTLLSYFIILRQPDSGGELFAYNVPADVPDPPKLANGWAWDLPAVEQRFGSAAAFRPGLGDLFVFASGRCLHRVAPTVGPHPRVTMGGFLALDRAGERVVYWS